MPYSRKEEAKKRLLTICEKENISYTEDGLKALIFTAQGDLRQAINNLQSCFDGFEKVTGENVFKVCDEPHPVQIKEMIGHCLERNFDKAYTILAHLWELGYSPEDIIVNMFRVTKNNEMGEYLKLEFVKEIGVTHAEKMKRVIVVSFESVGLVE